MRKMLCMMLILTAGMIYGEDECIAPEILNDLTVESEDTRITFWEKYADVIKKPLKPIREYEEKRGDGFMYKVLDYGTFKVLFDDDLKVRNVYFKKPGPAAMNGRLKIGAPINKLIKQLQNDSQYRVRSHGSKDTFYIEFELYNPPLSCGLIAYMPNIIIRYDEDGKVTIISYGFSFL